LEKNRKEIESASETILDRNLASHLACIARSNDIHCQSESKQSKSKCIFDALSFEHLLAWISKIQQVYMKDTNPDYIKKGVKEA